ncbi:hypothetical protein RQN30_00095 [Arcanobacterium hippocoleae]
MENGAEAIGACSSVHADIVILDVDMPVLDGIQAAGTIKRCFRTSLLSCLQPSPTKTPSKKLSPSASVLSLLKTHQSKKWFFSSEKP